MAQPATRRRAGLRTRIGAALLGGTLLLTGCAAGQRAATAVEVGVVDGVQGTVGTVQLRNVGITTPASGSYSAGTGATVQLAIVTGGAADKLLSVSTPAAKSAALYATPASTGTALDSIALPPGQSTVIGIGDAQPTIELFGLTSTLYPAMSVPITFTFQSAGTITLQVAVKLPTKPINRPTLAISPSASNE